MIGIVRQGIPLDIPRILMKLGMNNNYRTRVSWKKRTSVKQSIWVRYVRPAEPDLLNNLHAKIHVSHIGVQAMDRVDVVSGYDWLIRCGTFGGGNLRIGPFSVNVTLQSGCEFLCSIFEARARISLTSSSLNGTAV